MPTWFLAPIRDFSYRHWPAPPKSRNLIFSIFRARTLPTSVMSSLPTMFINWLDFQPSNHFRAFTSLTPVFLVFPTYRSFFSDTEYLAPDRIQGLMVFIGGHPSSLFLHSASCTQTIGHEPLPPPPALCSNPSLIMKLLKPCIFLACNNFVPYRVLWMKENICIYLGGYKEMSSIFADQ
jgi:hypothetical protein